MSLDIVSQLQKSGAKLCENYCKIGKYVNYVKSSSSQKSWQHVTTCQCECLHAKQLIIN